MIDTSAQQQEDETVPQDSLQKELDDILEKVMSGGSNELKEMLEETNAKWKATNILEHALKQGDIAPDFALPDQDGNIVSSIDLRAKGPLVVIFFRGEWCTFCNKTLKMIRKYTPHFRARGATVVAISPQTVSKSKQTVQEAGLNFPVLSDLGSEYAQLLNIAFVIDERARSNYEGFGITFQDYYDEDTGILPIPATYVIETDGRVTYSFVETDFTKRAEPVDILNALPPLKRKRRHVLSDRMDIEFAKLQDSCPPNKLKDFFEGLARAKASSVEQQALKVGDKAPDFKLKGRDGVYVDSKKLRKQGPLVISFNFGNKSPLCMTQLESMQRHLSLFEAKGANVVAISPSRASTNLFQIHAYSGAKFPLLTDSDNQKVAKKFGLMYQLPGLFVGESDASAVDLPMAATYVIDRSGYILYASVSADPTKRPEPSDVVKSIPTKFQPKAPLTRGPFSLLIGGRMAPSLRRLWGRQ